MFKTILLILVIAGAAFYASPYLAVQNLTQALEDEDTQSVEQYVDFPSVKENFKADFATRLGLSTAGDSAGNIGNVLATRIAGAFINGIVSPDTMVTILKDKQRRDRLGLSPRITDLLSRGTWLDMHQFVLHDDYGHPTALLQRNGLQWQVTAIRAL